MNGFYLLKSAINFDFLSLVYVKSKIISDTTIMYLKLSYVAFAAAVMLADASFVL